MNKKWLKFLEAVEKARDELGFDEGEECFYRGHANNRWGLLPTLLRHARRRKLDEYSLRVLEADLYFEFESRARDLHGKDLSDWEILQFMRHHAVATRLLDWTEIFGIGLYFALDRVPKGATPCLWLLNPYALNEHESSWETRDLISPKYLGKEGAVWDYSDYMTDFSGDFKFGWEHPVALYPIQRNSRLQAQRGYFTIHGDNRRAIDRINPDVVRRIDIDPSIIPDARRFLDLAGISDYTIFPDLDGLARDLHRKNKIV